MPRGTIAVTSGSDGATLATTNSDYDTFNSSAGNTHQVDLDYPTGGARSARFDKSNASGTNYAFADIPASPRVHLEIPVRSNEVPSGTGTEAPAIRIGSGTGSTQCALLQFTTSRTWRLRDAAGNPISGSSATSTTSATQADGDADFVMLLFLDQATGTAKAELWERGASAPVSGGTLSFTGKSIGAADYVGLRVGSAASTASPQWDVNFGTIIYDTDATDILPPSWILTPELPEEPTITAGVWLDLSAAALDGETVEFTASPDTGVYGVDNEGIFLPSDLDGELEYTVTASASNGTSAAAEYIVPQPAGADTLELLVWDGDDWV